MALVYIVRCNFNEPAKEQAWNAWYSGPKIAQMLAKPHFRSCQRFARTSGSGRIVSAACRVQTSVREPTTRPSRKNRAATMPKAASVTVIRTFWAVFAVHDPPSAG